MVKTTETHFSTRKQNLKEVGPPLTDSGVLDSNKGISVVRKSGLISAWLLSFPKTVAPF